LINKIIVKQDDEDKKSIRRYPKKLIFELNLNSTFNFENQAKNDENQLTSKLNLIPMKTELLPINNSELKESAKKCKIICNSNVK
jgi:hypothetical protein